jgi:YVTN family beta-propeller protein
MILTFTVNALAEPSGTYVYISNNNGASVSVIDPATLSKVTDIKTDNGPSDVIVNPAGTMLYVAYDKSPYVDVYSTTDYTLIKRIRVSANNSGWQFTRMTMNDEGTKLYITMYGDNSAYLVDILTSTVTVQKYMFNEAMGFARNPYGIKYYNGAVYVCVYTDPGGNGLVWKLDPTTLETLKDYGASFKGPCDIVIDNYNKRLLVCNNNATVTVINSLTDAVDGILPYSVTGATGCSASVNTTGYTYRAIIGADTIAIYNTTKALVTEIALPAAANPISVLCNNYNNTALVTGNGNGYLYVISMETNTITAQGFIGNGAYRISLGIATVYQHQTKFVIQSLFGVLKYENVTVSVYDENGIFQYGQETDESGQVSFYLQPTRRYTVTATSESENIDESMTIVPYDDTYYFNVWSFFTNWNPFGWIQSAPAWSGAGTGDVNKDIKINYSADTVSSPRVLLINYSDVTASTTNINFTVLRHWQENGSMTVYNTTLVAGSGITYRQMPIPVLADDADGNSYQIVVTATTGAYGTVKRMDTYHFPGVAYPLPGLPATWYPLVAFGVIVLFGLFFTYYSQGLGLLVMAFWGTVFMFMGWLAWSDTFLLLMQVLAVFGIGYIFKMKRQREGI